MVANQTTMLLWIMDASIEGRKYLANGMYHMACVGESRKKNHGYKTIFEFGYFLRSFKSLKQNFREKMYHWLTYEHTFFAEMFLAQTLLKQSDT